MPIRSFKDQGSRDIAEERPSNAARKKLPVGLHAIAYRKLVFLDNAHALSDLAGWKGLHLEKLRTDRAGQFSIRINNQYRICFSFTNTGATDVEIVDYH